MDDTEAAVPEFPPAIHKSGSIGAAVRDECDSVASMLRLEWDACYRRELPRLIRYLLSCFDNADLHDAGDAAQNAFLELFNHWHEVRAPRPWLRKVAFREMLKQPVRGEAPLESLTQEPTLLSAAAQLDVREQEQVVITALRRLPLAQRQVLALIYDEFSYPEIAEIMNTSEPAARKNAERARARMKEILGIR